MNVGMTTAMATSQGLTAGRLTAFTLRAAALMQGSFGMIESEVNRSPLWFDPSSVRRRRGRRDWGRRSRGSPAPDTAGPCGRGRSGCKTSPACGPVGGSL